MAQTAVEHPHGITVDQAKADRGPVQELFAHVSLVEGYDLPNYKGCHALADLRDQPGTTVAVLTTQVRLQSLLEEALETGYLVAFWGYKMTNPPTPRGGTWAVDVYQIDGVILYNMK